jgi:hypothetical protein
MYKTLLFSHSLFRWIALGALLYSIFRAGKGYALKRNFTKTDNAFRHWTATIAHIQLVIGIVLYTQSPIIKYYWANLKEAHRPTDAVFFGLVHMVLMLTALILITIGSALAKRKQTDTEKFKTILLWFSISLVIIFIAIPWPFSPLANRPYFR